MKNGLYKRIELWIAKGRMNERTKNICNLIETLGFAVEQAMTALKIPEDEKPKYRDLLKE